MKIIEWSEIWTKSYAVALREKTQKCYYYALKRIFKFDPMLLEMELDELKHSYFQAVITRMGDRYAKSSISHVIVVFDLMYKMAISEHQVEANPITDTIIPDHASQKQIEALTQDERQRLGEYLIHETYRDVIEFLLYTGLRRGELARLKWSDYDSKNGLIHIRQSKTRKGIRIVPLVPEAVLLIERQRLKSQKSGLPYIFINVRGGQLTSTVYNKLITRIKKKSGIENFGLHVLRHTFATSMVEHKADYKALSEILGHSSVSFTMQRYVSTEINFLRQQVMLISGAKA